MELLEVAAGAGADAVKFQTFKAASLVTANTEMADYQKENTGTAESQLEMLSRLELSYADHQKLALRAAELKIDFLSTAFDEMSLSFLVEDIQVPSLKIASGEINNGPLLLQHGRTRKNLIVSTGMSTLGEVEQALGVIAYAWSAGADVEPSGMGIQRAYQDPDVQALLREKVTLLHCTSQYPTSSEDVNLRAVDTMREAFGLRVGYSDHTRGWEVAIAAVARGACMIEKHFTLDKNSEGPDHAASIEPDELKQMVDSIRSVERALGDGVKGPRSKELEIMQVARKSLVAGADIAEGEAFSEENLSTMRPGTGRSPMEYWTLIGRIARRRYTAGDLIDD